MLRKHWLPQRPYFRVLFALVTAITVVPAGMTALNIRNTEERLKSDLIQRGQNQAQILAMPQTCSSPIRMRVGCR